MKPMLILCIGFAFSVGFAAQAHAEDPATRDWSIKAKSPLDKNPPPPADIRSFVNGVLKADMNPILCSFKFIDIAHDGNFILAASLDSSGRHYCNEMVVIGKKGSGFTVINQWKVWGVDAINDVLRDVDHDGREELLLPQNWAPYEGTGHCLPTWQTIFQWDNGKFVDHSIQFPEVYKARREKLKAAFDQGMGYGSEAVCQQMEMDKIDRFLGTEPHAGFARAEDWMKSNDSSLRRKAAAVFGDIGDADSRDDLKKLSEDPNSLVAETAKIYLEGKP